ncbi:hypothetical protein H2201_001127 [Coniosporium apollinis]|uniref:C3H1-type domain-containing protein n=1 Tax=Coniosporium apollinis TaxID=61459 RepID=A0ABQ9P2Q8_9PEZI|nr:hypothetical protein H2201_001127 [Coniosporium apollinis]
MDGDLVGAKQSPHKRDYSLASLATQFEQLSVASPKKDPLQGLAAYALLKTTPTKQATLPNWGLLESTEAMKKEEEAKSAPVAAAKNTTVAASMAKSKWAPTGAPVGMVQETLSPVAHYNSQALLHRPAEAAVMEAPRPESYSTSIPDVGTHATASREEKLATKPLNVEHDQPYDAGESVSPEYPRPTSSTASQASSVLAEGPEEDDTIPHPAVGKPSLFNPEAARLAKKDFEGMTKAQPGTKKRSRRGGRNASVPRGGSSSYAGPPFHGDFAPRGGSPARGGSLIRGGSLTHGSPSTRSSPSIRGNLAARGRSTTRPSSTTHGGLVSPSGGEPLRCFYQDREGGCPRASGECPFVHDRPHEEPEDKLAQEPSGDQSVGSRSVEHQSRSQLIDAQNNKVQTATTAQVKSVHAAQPVDIQDDSALVGGALSHGAHTGGAEHVVIPSVGIETITAADWDDIESVGVRSVGTESVGDHSDVSYPSDANSVITQHGSVMSSGAPSIGAASTGTPSVGAPATAVPPVGAPIVVTSYMSAPSTAAPSVGSPVVGAHSVGTPSVGAHSVDAPFVAAPSLAAPSFVASFISAPSAAPQSVAAQSASDLSTGGQSAGSQYGGTNQSRKKFGNGKAPCAFYTTPGGCPRGMYCHFFHDPAYDADRKTTATEGMLIGPHLYPGRDRM